jgi:phage N-6-adenine-methyltransferase
VIETTKRHTESVQHSSLSCDWGTPDELFRPLDDYFDFGLDVCASAANKKCLHWFGLDHPAADYRNALALAWAANNMSDRDVAFMNPPYSRTLKIRIEPWIEKAAYEATQGLTVVGVIPASVQTRWWQKYVRLASEIWFLTRRVSFVASPEMLADINAKRLERGKLPVSQAWNAGNNTAIVVWRPDPGFVGQHEPTIRYFSYKVASKRKNRTAHKGDER